MRTLYVLFTVTVMTLFYGPAVLIAKLFGVRPGPNSIYQRAMRNWARALCRSAGVRIRLHGQENVPQNQGVIYVANHVSWFDIFAMASVLPEYSFIAKSELRKIPLFGPAAEAAGVVFLERDNRKAAFESYRSAAREVEKGRNVVVYPEGTRGYDYHLRPFKKGPFVLAIAAHAPVVPTLVHGAREVMRKGSFRVRRGDVDIHFFPAIPTVGLDYDDRAALMTRVWSVMAEEMRELYAIGTREHPIAREKGVRASGEVGA